MGETNIRDWAEHERTYAMFLRLTKWGSISKIGRAHV